jgi:N-acetylneuraminic acid mutarotase
MRWLVSLVALVGCDRVFGLERIDAAPPDATVPVLGNWQQVASLPAGRDYNHGHAAFVGETLYQLGGFDAGESPIVYRARVTADAVSEWTETTPLPLPRALGDVVTVEGRIYVVGGANGAGAQSTVYSAEPAADGSITTWASLATLPAPRKAHAAASTNGYLYAFGGADSANTRLDSVFFTRIGSSGDLETWQTGTSLPAPRANAGGVAARGFLYAIGGDESEGANRATVFFAPVDAIDGRVGAWATTTELPFARRSLVALTDGAHIYVIGGVDTNAIGDVLYSKILDDGTLGPWEVTASLLVPRYRHAGVLANGKLFVLGGAEAATSVEQSTQGSM